MKGWELSDINVQLVREFFELNLFYVMPHWRFEEQPRDAESAGGLLFVEQPSPVPAGELECLLRAGDVKGIRRAVVEVRAWHADRLYPSVIEASPVFARVASQQTRSLADAIFQGEDYKIMIVVSEFSSSPVRRDQSVAALKKLGIDHVLEFPTILAEMLRLVSPQGSYAPSHTLQTMRLLKRYGFIRLQQLELFFPAQLPDAPVLPNTKGQDDVAGDYPDEDENLMPE